MREATGDVFVFVDDDNVLDSDYLSETVRIKESWPMLGVWGSGTTLGEFEITPPQNLEKYLPYLALRSTTAIHWTNVLPCLPATPWGAGLCVRASVAHAYRIHCDQSTIQVTGRHGNNLVSGEDVEISLVACKVGLGLGTFPTLKIIHMIPKERLRKDYLLKVIEGTTLSDHLLAFKWRDKIPRSPFSLRGALSVLKHTLLTRGMDRRAYFARLRASVLAKRIITASLSNPASSSIKTTL